MLLSLKHATHITGVAFGAMSLLLMHSRSFTPTESHLKCVNHNRPVATTSQTCRGLPSLQNDPKRMKHVPENGIMRDLVCGFSLLDQGPQHDNTVRMSLNFISSGFKQLFSSTLACDDMQTNNSRLNAYCKLRQMK